MKPAVTRVFMVRHGATVLSAEDRFAGATDVALSDEGREQTRRLAGRLSREKIMAVYAAPLRRAVGNAQILAAPPQIEGRTLGRPRANHHWRPGGMARPAVGEKISKGA